MRFSIRLILLTGSAALLIVLLALLIVTVQRTVDLYSRVQTAMESMQVTNQVSYEITEMLLRQYSLSQQHHLQKQIESKDQFVELNFKIYEKYIELQRTSDNINDLLEINELKQGHFKFENIAMRLFAADDLGQSTEAESALAEIDDQMDALGRKLGNLTDIGLRRSAEIAEDLRNSMVGHGMAIGAIIILTMLGSIAFAVLVRFTVLQPTKKLISGTEQVAAGNFDFRINVGVRNELGTLANSFNHMLERLRLSSEEISVKTAALENLNREITALNQTLERKVEERTRALRESELYLQRIIYGSPVSIAIFDKEGICTDCNDAFLKLIGAERRIEIIKKLHLGESPGLGDQSLRIALEGVLSGEKRRTEPVSHESFGQQRWFVHNLFPSFSLSNELERVILFSEDVTEQKLARDAIQAKNEELESFVFIVSHDLKSPIFTVAGLISMLESELGDEPTEQQRRLMGKITNNLNSMESMINDLLELSRVGLKQASFRDLDLSALVRAVELEERVRLGAEDIEVSTGDLPNLRADEQQITQLFRNLISNAIKYRKPAGKLVIRISGEEENGKCHFVINDNGIGIAEEHIDKVFDVFFRIKMDNDVEGTGVGLAIAKKVIENHGGEIWVDSVVGEGSSFHFTLMKSPDFHRDRE